ncbi:kinase-like protein [Pholiota conissans]|uniref:Kinase-like protein n=1 Tax=Pholiota conissans TaxID=109636 RepID=A0A9P5Z6A7_9AGAR|nr:kinase-like protein [Pholiota conissans]
MYIFDTSPYTSDPLRFTEEEIKNMLPPTYKAWKDSYLTFDFELGREHEKVNLRPEQCWWFAWKILRPFFQSKGYRLYDYDPQNDPGRLPRIVDSPSADSFGLYGDPSKAISHMDQNSTIFGARDSLNRDVVIKLVDKHSPDRPESSIELQILRLLNSPPLRANTRNATVPVLEFLEFHGWIFIVMPTHDCCDAYFLLSSRECLDFACQVLEALSFLHEHNIAHLDVSHENIMINYRGDIPKKRPWDKIKEDFVTHEEPPEFRSTFPIKYTLIDFDHSAYFLPGIPRNKRLISPSNVGRLHRAPEVSGRFKHDPFASDVYQTAVFFFSYFGHIIDSEVPGLLELLQDMSSIYPPDRISMAEAATRMRTLYEKLPSHETLPRHSIEVENYYYVPRSKFRYYREYLKWFISQKWMAILLFFGASDFL